MRAGGRVSRFRRSAITDRLASAGSICAESGGIEASNWRGGYAANAAVGKVVVDTDRNEVPADGQSPVQVTVKLFDKNGAPLTQPAFVTVETDGGRILVNGAPT